MNEEEEEEDSPSDNVEASEEFIDLLKRIQSKKTSGTNGHVDFTEELEAACRLLKKREEEVLTAAKVGQELVGRIHNLQEEYENLEQMKESEINLLEAELAGMEHEHKVVNDKAVAYARQKIGLNARLRQLEEELIQKNENVVQIELEKEKQERNVIEPLNQRIQDLLMEIQKYKEETNTLHQQKDHLKVMYERALQNQSKLNESLKDEVSEWNINIMNDSITQLPNPVRVLSGDHHTKEQEFKEMKEQLRVQLNSITEELMYSEIRCNEIASQNSKLNIELASLREMQKISIPDLEHQLSKHCSRVSIDIQTTPRNTISPRTLEKAEEHKEAQHRAKHNVVEIGTDPHNEVHDNQNTSCDANINTSFNTDREVNNETPCVNQTIPTTDIIIPSRCDANINTSFRSDGQEIPTHTHRAEPISTQTDPNTVEIGTNQPNGNLAPLKVTTETDTNDLPSYDNSSHPPHCDTNTSFNTDREVNNETSCVSSKQTIPTADISRSSAQEISTQTNHTEPISTQTDPGHYYLHTNKIQSTQLLGTSDANISTDSFSQQTSDDVYIQPRCEVNDTVHTASEISTQTFQNVELSKNQSSSDMAIQQTVFLSNNPMQCGSNVNTESFDEIVPPSISSNPNQTHTTVQISTQTTITFEQLDINPKPMPSPQIENDDSLQSLDAGPSLIVETSAEENRLYAELDLLRQSTEIVVNPPSPKLPTLNLSSIKTPTRSTRSCTFPPPGYQPNDPPVLSPPLFIRAEWSSYTNNEGFISPGSFNEEDQSPSRDDDVMSIPSQVSGVCIRRPYSSNDLAVLEGIVDDDTSSNTTLGMVKRPESAATTVSEYTLSARSSSTYNNNYDDHTTTDWSSNQRSYNSPSSSRASPISSRPPSRQYSPFRCRSRSSSRETKPLDRTPKIAGLKKRNDLNAHHEKVNPFATPHENECNPPDCLLM